MVPAADQTVFHAECQVVTAVPCFTTPGPSPRPRHACAWKTRPTAVTARHGEARKDTVRRAGGCHPISRGWSGLSVQIASTVSHLRWSPASQVQERK